NGELRGDKHTIWNGGLNVPFIVRWPGHHQAGVTSPGLVSTADIFATLADAVTGKVPAANEAAPDSFSFLPLLKHPEKVSNRPHTVLRDAAGRQAVLFGDWKFVDDALPDGKSVEGPEAEILFNLKSDPGETTNVIERYPDVAAQGRQLLDSIRNQPASRGIQVP
ncbi:MAG: sulfatase-like hydrolase/transferase, partial [Verrucomicrobiae bacterium]|nr:sulfatase-like hydrolase/transferase [Verrucomicrobiae bacterium]